MESPEAQFRAHGIARHNCGVGFIKALRTALNRATEWGVLSAMSLGKIKFGAEDENAVVRYLSDAKRRALRSALVAQDNKFAVAARVPGWRTLNWRARKDSNLRPPA